MQLLLKEMHWTAFAISFDIKNELFEQLLILSPLKWKQQLQEISLRMFLTGWSADNQPNRMKLQDYVELIDSYQIRIGSLWPIRIFCDFPRVSQLIFKA